MLKQVANISLYSIEPDKNGMPRSKIFIDGMDISVIINGVILEAAFAWNERYLVLFVTNDIPFEESLHIYLLDKKINQIIDSATICGMYATDSLSYITISDDAIYFNFLTEADWKLTLLSKPKRVFTLCFFPFSVVTRPFTTTRYFTLKNRS